MAEPCKYCEQVHCADDVPCFQHDLIAVILRMQQELAAARALLREAAGWCERTGIWEVKLWAEKARAAGGGDA